MIKENSFLKSERHFRKLWKRMFVLNTRNMWLLISDIEKIMTEIQQFGFLFSEFRLRMRLEFVFRIFRKWFSDFRNDLFNTFESRLRIFGISFSKQNRTRLFEIQILIFWISECHILNIWKSYSTLLNYDLCKLYKLIIYLLSINENYNFIYIIIYVVYINI